MTIKGKSIHPYDVLGVDAAATVDEMNAAYRRRAKDVRSRYGWLGAGIR